MKTITIPSEDVKLDWLSGESVWRVEPRSWIMDCEVWTIAELYEKPSGFVYIREITTIVSARLVKPISEKLIFVDRKDLYHDLLPRRRHQVWRWKRATYPLGERLVDILRYFLGLEIKPLKTRH